MAAGSDDYYAFGDETLEAAQSRAPPPAPRMRLRSEDELRLPKGVSWMRSALLPDSGTVSKEPKGAGTTVQDKSKASASWLSALGSYPDEVARPGLSFDGGLNKFASSSWSFSLDQDLDLEA